MTREYSRGRSGTHNHHHKHKSYEGSDALASGFSSSAFHGFSGPTFGSNCGPGFTSAAGSGGGGEESYTGGASGANLAGGHSSHARETHVLGSHEAMDATFIWKLTKLGRIGSSRLRFDDDFADRLNYQFTGVLMFLFIGLIGIRQYVGKPIQCWVPQSFSRGWEEYSENFCWVTNTYYSAFNVSVHDAIPESKKKLISYYQWVPVMLAIQALLVYMPCLIWRLMIGHSGFNIRRILQMACDSNLLLPEHTLKNVRFIARYMEGCIYRQRDYKKHIFQQQIAANLGYSGTNPQSHYSTPGNPYAPIGFIAPPPHYSSSGGKTKPPPPTRKNVSSQGLLISASENQPLTGSITSDVGGRSFLQRFRSKFYGNEPQQGETKLTTRNPGKFQAASKVTPSPTDSKTGSINGITGRNGTTPRSPTPRTVNRSRRGPYQTDNGGFSLSCCGKRHGNYLTVLYFSIKFLYLINIFGQIFLMEIFVGFQKPFYGIRMLIDLLSGHNWELTGNFPRVTFCEIKAKKLGTDNRHILQCVLPLNMFLEKIFIFLWFWHVCVGLITLCSFFNWFIQMGFAKRRIKFIRKYLKIMCVMRETDKASARKFVENYLRPDGVFILRLISINVGDFIAGDLACELWHIYRHKRLQNIEEIKFLEGECFGATQNNSTQQEDTSEAHKNTAPSSGVLIPAPQSHSNTNNFNNDDGIV